jgi:hypothetical protein
MEHIGESYAEYLESESTVQIYGTLSDGLAQTIDVASQGRTDEAATIREPFASFSRLPAGVTCRTPTTGGSDGTDTQHCLRPPDR